MTLQRDPDRPSDVTAALRELIRAVIGNATSALPRYRWARVTATAPLTLLYLDDRSAGAAAGLRSYVPAVGDTVLVVTWAGYAVVVGAGGAGTEPVWLDMALLGGWTAYNPKAGVWAFPQYTKTRDGVVYLSGLVAHANAAESSTIAILPEGYRPLRNKIYACMAGGGLVRVEVESGGTVRTQAYVAGGSASFVALDVVSFPTLTA